jgi:serine/threonine-protein kinase
VIDVGSVIANKYRLVRLLGEGGMGSVYEAQHLTLGSPVAVKLLHPELSRRGGLVERFLQEARVAAQIRSPHVVRVSDVDRTSDGHAYIVMDLLVGEPLAAALQREGRLPIPVACDYTSQILAALEVAHGIGVIHRDLKPENVFVTTESGKPLLKIIDFGIAKAKRGEAEKTLTVAGSLMGTAEYMAPEQARSAGAVDARADIYAVGVMLYEMIAGVRPVTGDDARDVAAKVERGEVVALLHVAPGTPREIAGLVHHAMAPRPEMRFGSAAEMRAALAEAQMPKVGSRVPGAPGSSPGYAPASAPGAPAPGSSPAMALTPSPAPAPAGDRVRTERALPISAPAGPAFVAAGGTAVPLAKPVPEPEPPRRGRGVLLALLVLGIIGLVGAGGVLLVQSGVLSQSTPEPAAVVPPPPVATDPNATSTATATAGPTAPTVAPGRGNGAAVPTLAPAGPVAPVAPGKTTPVAPGSGGHAPSSPSAEPLFPGFPTALPGFPGSLPSSLPFVLPSALPSTFPTALPSGFPVFPGWPAAPPKTSAGSGEPSPSAPAAPAQSSVGPTI